MSQEFSLKLYTYSIDSSDSPQQGLTQDVAIFQFISYYFLQYQVEKVIKKNVKILFSNTALS